MGGLWAGWWAGWGAGWGVGWLVGGVGSAWNFFMKPLVFVQNKSVRTMYLQKKL